MQQPSGKRDPGEDAPPSGSDRPIFIVGCARSGTTLLQLMLHAHPRIAIPPETRYLMEVYERRVQFGDLSDVRNRRALAEWIVDRRGTAFRDLRLDGERVKDTIVAGPPTLGSALGAILAEYAARFGKPRWGDKRPNYIRHPEVLLRLFPDAQIIHVVRDGRACVASLKRMPWWKHGSIAAMHKWVAAMHRGRRLRRELRRDQYIEVSYERLVADPRAELQRLCDFLGEQLDEAMLAPHRVAPTAVPRRKVWHERTKQAVGTVASAGWMSELEPWEVRLFELVARRALRRHGYQPSQRRLPPAAKLAQYARFALRARLSYARWCYREARRRRRYPWPVAARLTDAQRRLADLHT